MKKTTYLFFFVFLCGVICANISGVASGRDLGAMNEYFMNRYMYADIQGRELFLYLFYERAPEFLLLLILSIGIYGMLVVDAYICYLGFSVGFISVIAIINYGIKGALLILGFFFPQWLFYVPVLVIWHSQLRSYKKLGKDYLPDNKKKSRYMKYLLSFVVACLFFLGGILLESYVNPYLLQKIIRTM